MSRTKQSRMIQPLSSPQDAVLLIKMLNARNVRNTRIAIKRMSMLELGQDDKDSPRVIFKTNVESECGRDTACTNGKAIWISWKTMRPGGDFALDTGHFPRPTWVSHFAQMVLHEFGHLTQGHSYTKDLSGEEKEKIADEWAMAFIAKASIYMKISGCTVSQFHPYSGIWDGNVDGTKTRTNEVALSIYST